MHAIFAIARKDLVELVRDKTGFFFVFVFPLLIGILFGYLFSGGGGDGPTGIQVIVVDADQSPASRSFVEAITTEGTLVVTQSPDADAAIAQVRKGDFSAAIVVPKGFQDGIRSVFEGKGAPIEVAIDPARQFDRGIIEGMVMSAGFRTLATTFTDPAQALSMLEHARAELAQATDVPPFQRGVFETLLTASEALAKDQAKAREARPPGETDPLTKAGADFNPIRVTIQSVARERSGPRSAFEISFPQSSAWGIVGVVMGFGASLVTERTSGTLTRLFLSPLTRWQVIGGKALGCFLGAVIVQALLFAIGVAFFGIRPQSWPLLALAVVCGSVCFVGVMMTLAVVGKTAAASSGITRAVILVLALVGGAGVPLFVMPPFMRMLAGVSPFKWLILSLEGALWRGWGIGEMVVPCVILVSIGVAGFVVGALLFREEA